MGKSIRNGYSVAVLNHLAPKNELTSHMRLIDFSDPATMHNAYNFVKKHFPECDKIFGVGFSLGGCYLLKSIGAPNDEN